MKKKLSKSQQLIIDTLNDVETLTYEELAHNTGLSYDGVRGRISELNKMGYKIDRMRDGTNTFLMYKPSSTYRRPLDIRAGMAEKIKAIDDFYKITDFLDSIRTDKVKKKKFPAKGITQNDKYAVLLLSDLHIGELIWSPNGDTLLFDTETALMRIEDMGNQVIDKLKSKKISHLYILSLGDMIDGDAIYRNHLFRVEKPAVEQVQDAVKAISSMVKHLVVNKISVEMYSVRGNHGITNYQNIEEDNWDNVVYDMLDLIFMDDENVLIHNFNGAEGLVNIGDRKIVMTHGKRLGSQIKTATGLREFRGMCNKHNLDIGDMIVVGHLHEFGVETDQGRFLIRNGAVSDSSEYAYKLNLYSEPMQTLMIFEENAKYPNIIPIELTD